MYSICGILDRYPRKIFKTPLVFSQLMSVDGILREEQDRAFVLGLPTAEVVATVNPRDGHFFIEFEDGLYMVKPGSEITPFSASYVPINLKQVVNGADFAHPGQIKTINGFKPHPTFNGLLANQDGPVRISRIVLEELFP